MPILKGGWPRWQQWRRLPKLLSTKERFQLLAGFFLIVISTTSWLIADRIFNYETAPAFGGEFSEALVGQPQYINPVLANTGLSNVDQDIISLVFSGLMKITPEGTVEPDLASRYEIEEEGKVYTVWLKNDIYWHDGKPITADDVVFTINTIKNPDTKSPLRLNWQGVQIEKLNENTLRFKLETPAYSFLQHLSVGILPSHIWSNVSVRNFGLAEPNLAPTGSGPYKFEKFQKDGTGFIRSITLKANENFYRRIPYIETIVFKFYQSENEAIAAWNNEEVSAINNISPKSISFLKNTENASNFNITLPRFFGVFFNLTQSSVLADRNVRLALQLATNKKEVIKEVADTHASLVSSPFPSLPQQNSITDTEKANEILENAKWDFSSSSPTVRRKKILPNEDEKPLHIQLTIPNIEELKKAGEVLKKQWESIGAEIELIIADAQTVQSQVIRPRNYEALLFGLAQGAEPDPYIFWHSSQKRDPGFNLALYDNTEVDELLEKLRETQDKNAQNEILQKIDEQIQADVPAIFLYNPYYIYTISSEIKGVSLKNMIFPFQRLGEIENWYISTSRVRK